MENRLSRMTADEWRKGLQAVGLNATEVCRAIYFETGTVINPDYIRKEFIIRRQVSLPLTGCLRYFFKLKGFKYDDASR